MFGDDSPAGSIFLATALSQLAFYLPLFVVYGVGIAVAQRYRPRYPGMARRVRFAVLIDLVAILPGTLAVAYFTAYRQSLEMLSSHLSLLFGAIAAVRALIHAAASAVLLSAAFADRERPAPAAPRVVS